MTVSVRLNENDEKLFKKYAEMHGMSLSDLFRDSVMERIENEFDLRCYEAAKAEYDENPVTYTLDEVKKELGL